MSSGKRSPCPAEPPSSLLLILGHRKKGATHQRRLLWDERVCLCQDAAQKEGQSLGEAGKGGWGGQPAIVTGLGGQGAPGSLFRPVG